MTGLERDALQRDMGRLEARVDALEEELREIKADVKSILALVAAGYAVALLVWIF